MKIIVFGGAGFLGSHVADVLVSRGHETIIYDLKESPYLKTKKASIVNDITDKVGVEKAVKGCDIVYHFAGIADMDQARLKPLDTVKNNILGTAVILEACRKNKVKRIIFASSLYVYSKAGSFYRSSKQASELLIENYLEVFGLDFTILRYGSLYGPRSDENNWVYRILKQAFLEKKIVRHGDGEELRDYIHVLDAARLSVECLSEEYRNQHVIITGNQQMKTKELLGMIKEMLNNKIEIEFKKATYNGHYELTPYAFRPVLAKRIQAKSYVDLGQGIVDLMAEVYKECIPHKKHNGIYLMDEKK